MKFFHTKIIPALVICILSAGFLFAQEDSKSLNNNAAKSDKLPSIEVSKFDQEPNVGFPTDYYDEFAEIMIEKLKESGKFNQVILADADEKNIKTTTAEIDTDNKNQQPPIRFRLSGTITNYTTDKGVSLLLLGYRSQEIIIVRITLLDKTSGKVILEKKVDGSTLFNFRRGNVATDAAMKGVAIQAVRNINKTISK